MQRKLAVLLALLTMPVVIVVFWVTSPASTSAYPGALVTAFGRLCGLLGAASALTQLMLIGRLPWIEKALGMDKLARMHAALGPVPFFLLLAHAILLSAGAAAAAEISLWRQVGDYIIGYPYVLLAAIALGVFFFVDLLSNPFVRPRIRFEVWYYVHLFMYAAVALAFAHQIVVGTTLITSRAFRIIWFVFYAAVILQFAGFRLGKPMALYLKHRFAVAEVTKEIWNTTSLIITGRRMEDFRYRGGQFIFVRFLAPGYREPFHPFSLSRPPDGKSFRLTIKSVGDYTAKVADLKPGTRVFIEGPLGVFTADRSRREKVLCIAGGVGITPIRSLIKDLLDRGTDVVLLYGVRNPQELIFREELERLQRDRGLVLLPVSSEKTDGAGLTGFIDGALIRRAVPDFVERDVFLCGPPVMMKLVTRSLTAAGVSRWDIYSERFGF